MIILLLAAHGGDIAAEETIILSSERAHNLSNEYQLFMRSVDYDGDKLYLELLRNGQTVDGRIIIPANEVDDTFIYFKPGASQQITAHARNAFRGADKNMVTLDRVLQTSEAGQNRILLTGSVSQILSQGEPLKLYEGYELALRSVDIDGNRAFLELLKNGQTAGSQLIIAANEANGTFVYSLPETGPIIQIHFSNAFRGADQCLAKVDVFWQRSETEPSKILMQSHESFTVTTGVPLKFEEGYELTIKSVDIDGNKIYVELSKGGAFVASEVIVASEEPDDMFTYSREGTARNIRIHVRNAFRGASRTMVTIDDVYQTSEADATRILINSSTPQTVASGTPLRLSEGYALAIKSIDINGKKAYIELLKDGEPIYSSLIVTANEIDDSLAYSKPGTGQEIDVHFKNAYRGADQDLVTLDHIRQISETDPARTLIDDNRSIVASPGTPLRLQEGYCLATGDVDIDGNKAYVELSKDGVTVAGEVIIAANDADDTLVYSDPQSESKVTVHIKNTFRGQNREMVTVDRILQTSQSNRFRTVMDESHQRIVPAGGYLPLKEGYGLAVKSVDINGKKAYVELLKDGAIIDGKVIVAANEADGKYVWSGAGGAQEIAVHFKNVYRSSDQNLATIDRVWKAG